MAQLNSLENSIKSVNSESFDQVAVALFNYQASNNVVFQNYLKHLGHPLSASSLDDIVFMPIEFFKNHTIKTGAWEEETVFESSGTTGNQTSRHFVYALKDYRERTAATFEEHFGSLKDYVILGLLPSYLERGNSGLISMVDHFIQLTAKPESGFYLDEFALLSEQLKALQATKQKTILWGVTFALLDFAQQYPMHFPDLIIMETGGMKGRRKELLRSELHQSLNRSYGTTHIHSEYGMTELNSQAYAKENGQFLPARSMKVLVRDLNDPFKRLGHNKTGALNIIDLQNLHTCAFIETKDLGRSYENGAFEVMGRMDNADLRGCNLMVI